MKPIITREMIEAVRNFLGAMVLVTGFIFLFALLSGCASPPEQIVSPDGKKGFLVYCQRGYESKNDCHQKARAACGGDYKVRTESSVGMEVICNT